MSRKHQIRGPRTPEEFAREAAIMSRGPRIPGDDITDMLRAIGDDMPIEEADPGVPPTFPETDGDPEEFAGDLALESVIRIPTPRRQADIPVEILDVLQSEERHELIEVARMLRRSHEQAKTMLFMTPVGDIKCPVTWLSCNPRDISQSSMFFVKTKANSLAFIPKAGAVFDIAFEGYPGQVKVVCLAEPQKLYPGVDLLCFMPHNPFMEKTGQLKEGAPSVVSGDPSTDVVEGEPVVRGEQPIEKSAFKRVVSGNEHTGYDNPRPL